MIYTLYEVNKTENHRSDLVLLIKSFVATGDPDRITEYILSNSNLPGRRANLELAQAFGDAVALHTTQETLWELCRIMTTISAEEAPVNAPREFIPFCGTIGIGSLGSACPERFTEALTVLKGLAKDPRWRMREAVCFGLQRLMAERRDDTLTALKGWIRDGTVLQMRAVAAAVGEPVLLSDRDTALAALQVHQSVMNRVLATGERKSDEFRTLRKALGYTLSIVIAALPTQGFEFLAQLAQTSDRDALWIAKQNLKKKRLVKHFPAQVAFSVRLLDS